MKNYPGRSALLQRFRAGGWPVMFGLLLLVVPALFVQSAPAPRAEKKIEAFWQTPPPKDDSAVFLWRFDSESNSVQVNADDEINDLLTLSKDAASVSLPDAGPTGQPGVVNYTTKGDAAPDSGGRFGGALRLKGKGWVESGPIDIHGIIRDHGAVTFDFWVNPDATDKAAVLLALPRAPGKAALSISRDPGGVICLATAQGTLLTHSRLAPAGQWTHIALIINKLSPSSLLVNGAAIAVPPDQLAAFNEALLAASGRMVCLGGLAAATPGFAGRLDVARMSRGQRLFYELTDQSFCDLPAARALETGLPWFARKQPLNVYCSFDNTLTPQEFSGVKAAGATDPSLFQAGVRGMALDLSQPKASSFLLAGQSSLPLERGTLELWFKPLNWDNLYVGESVPSLALLRFAKPGAPAGRGLRALVLSRGRRALELKGNPPWTEFQPGKWTHLVCTWDGAARRVYLDGKPQVLNQASLAGPLNPADKADHEQWLKSSNGKDDATYALTFLPTGTLVDELRVYPWALTAEEAQNAYVRYFPDGAKRLMELPRLLASTSYDYYQKGFKLSLSCQPVDGIEPAAATARILRKGVKDPVLNIERIELNASLQGGWGGVVPLDFGEYELQVDSLSAEGKVLYRLKQALNRPQPDWWQNDLGKDAIVPKPWTPIAVDGSTLKVWGRDYALGGGGLVTGLVSAAAPLLAGPPRLYGKVNGKDVRFEGAAPEVGKRSPQLVEWTGELRAEGLRAAVRATLEYDGLVSYTISLQPDGGAPATVESLCLDFPLLRKHATQFIVNGGGHNFRASWVARFVPDGSNTVWHSGMAPGHKGVAVGTFCPLVWIGDDQRGLSFFGENDKGWTPGTPVPAQEIVRNGPEVIYRMNIISRPVKVETNRDFTFALHPTPTKPLPADWRSLNARGDRGKRTGRDGIDSFLGYTLTAPSNVFNAGITFAVEPVSWEDARNNAASLRKKIGDNPVMFYIDCSWPQMGPSMNDFKASLWWTGRMTWSREVEDYFVWIINEYLKRDIIDGIYIDDASFGSTRALYSTAYTLEDGQTQPGFSTMGFRRFLQRVWVLCEKQGKRPIILPHMTYCFEIPALSFAESTVNGEDRDIAPYAKHRYPDVWSLEELRVMGSSEKWGFVTFWKPGVRADFDYRFSIAARQWIHQQSRAMQAVIIPHDYWYLWIWPTANGIRPAIAKFGVDDPAVRFIPYWNLEGKAAVTGKQTILTLYAKPDRALLMVSNLSKEDQDVTVSIDPAKLFGSAAPGRVTWQDIDPSLIGPKSDRASASEIKELSGKTLETVPVDQLASDDNKAATEDMLQELLGNKATEDQEVQRLKIRPDETRVGLVVRKQDYRLLEVRLVPAGK